MGMVHKGNQERSKKDDGEGRQRKIGKANKRLWEKKTRDDGKGEQALRTMK